MSVNPTLRVNVYDVITESVAKRAAIRSLTARWSEANPGREVREMPMISNEEVAEEVERSFPLRTPVYPGFFHQWSTEMVDGEQYPVAIIEDQEGNVETRQLREIQFI